MKSAELRDLSLAELLEKERELEEELFRLKIKRFTSQIENKMLLRTRKKVLARVKTIITEKRCVKEENT